MRGQLLLISDRPDDLKFFQQICTSHQLDLERQLKPEGIQEYLSKNPNAVVFWDAENNFIYSKIEGILKQSTATRRLFAIGDRSFHSAAYFSKYPIFSHHLLRMVDPVTIRIYGYLAKAAAQQDPAKLKDFFPEGTEIPVIVLKHTSHKRAAIEAVQNVMKKKGNTERISALAAQAVDELILNALFDAPVERGKRTKEKLERSSEFDLIEKEYVEVRMAQAENYMGVSVHDQFGSLTRQTLVESFLRKAGKTTEVADPSGAAAKIGFNRVFQGGFSLLFSVVPQTSTELMLFFKLTENYREFKKSFQFMSLNLP